MRSTLESRNIVVKGHRTSMRLEPAMWRALEEICRRQSRSVNELCSMIEDRRSQSSLTSAVRVFLVTYFRTLALAYETHAGASGRRDGMEETTAGYRAPPSAVARGSMPFGAVTAQARDLALATAARFLSGAGVFFRPVAPYELSPGAVGVAGIDGRRMAHRLAFGGATFAQAPLTIREDGLIGGGGHGLQELHDMRAAVRAAEAFLHQPHPAGADAQPLDAG